MYDPGGTLETSLLTNEDEELGPSELQDEGVFCVSTNDDFNVSGLWCNNLASVKTNMLEVSQGAWTTRDLSKDKKEAINNSFVVKVITTEDNYKTVDTGESSNEVTKDHTTSGLNLFDPGGSNHKDLLNVHDSQLQLNLSTLFDPGGASGGIYSHGETVIMFSNSMGFTSKDQITNIILTSFGHKVPPQVPGIIADWGLLAIKVCSTLQPSSVSHANFCHVLDLSCDPLDNPKCSFTLFDPGGRSVEVEENHATVNCDELLYKSTDTVFYLETSLMVGQDYFVMNLTCTMLDKIACRALFDPGGNYDEILANTAIDCGDEVNYYQVVIMVPTDSKLEVTDMDHSLSSVNTLVFDPGGSYVKDLNIDFSTLPWTSSCLTPKDLPSTSHTSRIATLSRTSTRSRLPPFSSSISLSERSTPPSGLRRGGKGV